MISKRDIAAGLAADLFKTAPHTLGYALSGGEWKPYRHLRYLSEIIARGVVRGGLRLVVNMGPGMGKSQLISKWLPVWHLEHWPNRRVIVATHTKDLGTFIGRQIRDTFEHEPSGRLRTKIKQDVTAAAEWETTAGGGCKAVGIGGALMGFRGHLVIVDDPYPDWASAQSPTYRADLEAWFHGTLMNRLEPRASVVVLHHRLHAKDLTHHIRTGEDGRSWQVLSLPSVAKADDPLGRQPGEALCPERYDAESLKRTAPALTGPVYRAMHDQDPDAVGTGVVYKRYSGENMKPLQHNPRLPLVWTFDFNINPGMHALVGQYDGRADLFTVLHEVHDLRMDLPSCLQALERWAKEKGGAAFPWPELRVYGDPAGNAESHQTGRSSYDLIRAKVRAMGLERKLWLSSRTKAPPIVDRQAAVNDALCDMLGARHVAIDPSCTRLVRDFEELELGPDGRSDKSQRELSHPSEAFGYWVYEVRPAGGAFVMPMGRTG